MYLPEKPERTVHDFHNLTHNRFKRIYFKRDPKDPKRIQTVHYHLNIFSGIPEARYSNFNYEEPQQGWVELTPQEESALCCLEPVRTQAREWFCGPEREGVGR